MQDTLALGYLMIMQLNQLVMDRNNCLHKPAVLHRHALAGIARAAFYLEDTTLRRYSE